jgi:phosphotriesterase-related protein
MVDRRTFLKSSVALAGSLSWIKLSGGVGSDDTVMTVNGLMIASEMGNTLVHEHILVDFIGADKINPSRWNTEAVIKRALPFLIEVKNAGCKTLIDCTPNFLGRDVRLLKALSEKSGLHIITNTGYYGGSDEKFIPAHAFKETAEELSKRWTDEWQNGIDGTSVKPGFQKISVNPGALSEISKKLIQAAALTHLSTGLIIASHTGPAAAAFEQIRILKNLNVSPRAFIWVHAQNETELKNYVTAASEGAWISLDGVNADNIDHYVTLLNFMKKEGILQQTLISHDAGWYDPGKPDGGSFRTFTTLYSKLLPALKQKGFTESEIEKLMVLNPQQAFAIKIWLLGT